MMKLLVLILLAQISAFNQAKAEVFTISQESGFTFMYETPLANRLLYEAEVIVENTLEELGCEVLSIDSKVTQEMYRPSLIGRIAGEKDIEPRFFFETTVNCPSPVSQLQGFVSFSFHTSDIGTVFYYAYENSNSGVTVASATVDRWGSAPQDEPSFKGFEEDCQSTWVGNSKYNLLLNEFCW